MTKAQRKAQVRELRARAQGYRASKLFAKITALHSEKNTDAKRAHKALSTTWLKKHRTDPKELFNPTVTAN